MMNKLVGALLLLVASGQPWLASADEQAVGVAELAWRGDAQHRGLDLTVWYPAEPGGERRPVGANAVFQGAVGRAGADPLAGRLPLVLVSHGGLRSASNSGAWLASGLAGTGVIAVELSAERPASAAEAVAELWRRPADISAALDFLLRHPRWSPRVDADRVGVVGAYLGGTAALLLSDTPVDEAALRASCERRPAGPDCPWLRAQGVGLGVPHLPSPPPLTDARLRVKVALAPEYAWAFPALSTPPTGPALPVLVDRGDGAGWSRLAVDFNAAPVSSFDAFGVYRARGAGILQASGADTALCGRAADRALVHRRLLGAVASVFDGW